MKKKFAKKLSTYSICIILQMLTLVGCANSDTSSTITKSNLHVTEKETLSTETKKSDSTPESTPKVESNSTNENQVNTSNTSDSESNEYSEPMNKEQSTSYVEQETYVSQSSQTQASIPAPTPVPPAPEPVSTPAIPEPTAIPTPVPTPVATPEPVDESCHVEPLGNCHVGTCMSLDEVVSKGEAWEIEHNYMGGVTFGDEDWDGCYVYYTNDGQFQVGVD